MIIDPIDPTHGSGPLLALLPHPVPAVIAETAAALANTDGGALVFGLTAAGQPAAVPDLDAVADAVRHAVTRCQPPLNALPPERLPGANGSGPLVAVRVPRSQQIHALADGRVYVRAGQGNRLLGGDEIQRAISDRTVGDFEREIVPGVYLGDLDLDRVVEFAARRRARLHLHDNSGARFLVDMGAVTSRGAVTVLGLLLFGRTPQQWLPYAAARFTRVVGTRADNGAALTAHEETIGGPLPALIDALEAALAAQLPATRNAPGNASTQPPAYPAVAVREVLVNALAHRDYRVREPVRVTLYDDQLVVTSPGGLPGFMTTASLLGGHLSRNPGLCWGLHHLGYVERAGFGVGRIITSLSAPGQRPAEFDAHPTHLTVRLHRAQPVPQPVPVAAGPPLSAAQQAALDHVRQYGRLTLRELRTICPNTSPTVLQRELSALVERDHLRRVGPRSGAFYILP